MQIPEVNITRRYYCSQEKLWNAIAEGQLFILTGADQKTASFEFKKTGKISLNWNDYSTSMTGEFLEITPMSKVVLTWNTSQKVNSTVFLTIQPFEKYCELNLRHEFPSGTETKAYDWGWDESMYDLKELLYK
ncbi:MAG: SRPBCC domain-containing protein [Pseudobdellovibrionaceae bacterium]